MTPGLLFHLMTAEHAISSIALRRLKVVRLPEANDPFELFALNCIKGEARQKLNEFKKEQSEKQGMLCFSRSWKHPMLWSHYANGHKGICLGFEVGSPNVPQPVVYSKEKFQLEDRTLPFSADLKRRLLVTKYKHWDYEEESRVFVDLGATAKEGRLRFVPFTYGLELREVILGPLCDVPYKAVLELTRQTNRGATVAKARLGYKFFEVKIDGHYPPKA